MSCLDTINVEVKSCCSCVEVYNLVNSVYLNTVVPPEHHEYDGTGPSTTEHAFLKLPVDSPYSKGVTDFTESSFTST